MCLGIPGRVVEIVDGYAGQLALVDVEGARRRVNIGMLDAPPACGDWVLLHMGFALEVIDGTKAAEALSGLEMMGRGRTAETEPGTGAGPEDGPEDGPGPATGPGARSGAEPGGRPAPGSGPTPGREDPHRGAPRAPVRSSVALADGGGAGAAPAPAADAATVPEAAHAPGAVALVAARPVPDVASAPVADAASVCVTETVTEAACPPVPRTAPAPAPAPVTVEAGSPAAAGAGALRSGCGAEPGPCDAPPGVRVRRRFEVRGVVQGVGFRPFVYVTADALALSGSVANTGSGVVADVEGEAAAVAEFGQRLRTGAPPLALVESVTESARPPRGTSGFTIEESGPAGRARTLVSPDIATCADCLAELADPGDRRYRHPFVTCTHCGPRYTIVTGTPYDRATTTMAGFAMCAECRTEYEDPRDRRFHAQPIACHACGPRLELVRADGAFAVRDDDALRTARRLLAQGAIVAVKGLGGYHLACDARDAGAVAELRRRKRRGGKPFAVMVKNLDVAREFALVSEDETQLLAGPRRPIVLLPRRAGGLPDAVAPGAPDLGLMLPYTPLHVLLFGLDGDPGGPDALVMTSGNLSGEPIVTDDVRALSVLAPLADAWLRHDRPIRVPCDDSVSRFVAGAELPLRRARGYAPLPLALPFDVPPLLAAGADLKNTCALGEGGYAWVSQHIGDMDDLATLDALTATEAHLELLTGTAPAPWSPTCTRTTAPAAGRVSTPAAGRCARRSTTTRTSPPSWASTGSARTTRSSASPSTARGTAPTARCGAVRCCSAATAPCGGRRTSRTCRSRAGTPVCGARTGWRSRICTPRVSAGTRRCRPWRPALPVNRSCCGASWRPGSGACRHPAWVACSTRSPRWPVSGRRSPTRRRRPSRWRGSPGRAGRMPPAPMPSRSGPPRTGARISPTRRP